MTEGWKIISIIANGVLMLVSLAVNAFTIAAVAKYPKLHNVTTIFIINLCVADIIYCLSILPFDAIRFVDHEDSTFPSFCALALFYKSFGQGMVFWFIELIAINRYISIVHPGIYNQVYRKKWIILMIAFCYVFTFVLLLPTTLGVWGKFSYLSPTKPCSMVSSKSGNPKYVLVAISFLIPSLIIVICYTKIYLVVRSSEKKLRQHSTTGNDRKEQKIQWKVSKISLIIFLAFWICYLPTVIVRVADRKGSYPGLYEMASFLHYCMTLINPIVYVVMSKEYRRAYASLISNIKNRMTLNPQTTTEFRPDTQSTDFPRSNASPEENIEQHV